MANPKSRWSKKRTHNRRSQWKLSVPGIVKCSQCHSFKLPHRVCKECGYYDGKEVIKVEA